MAEIGINNNLLSNNSVCNPPTNLEYQFPQLVFKIIVWLWIHLYTFVFDEDIGNAQYFTTTHDGVFVQVVEPCYNLS